MRVHLSDPTLMDDLVAFLERASCIVSQEGADIVAAALPEAESDEQARLELQLYLLAWQALHPATEARLTR
jgi:hypothetical protein